MQTNPNNGASPRCKPIFDANRSRNEAHGTNDDLGLASSQRDRPSVRSRSPEVAPTIRSSRIRPHLYGFGYSYGGRTTPGAPRIRGDHPHARIGLRELEGFRSKPIARDPE